MPVEFCPSCGNQRIGGMRFCSSCRFDFADPAPLPAAAPPTPTRPASEDHSTLPRRGWSGIERAVAALIVLTVVGGGAYLLSRGPNAGAGTVGTPQPTSPPVQPTLSQSLAPTIGPVEFGLDYNHDTLDIIKPTTRFKDTYPAIAWTAHLTVAADAGSLTRILASVSGSGSESVLSSAPLTISDPRADTIAAKEDFATMAGYAPGTYVVRILRDSTILAEGTFTLVP